MSKAKRVPLITPEAFSGVIDSIVSNAQRDIKQQLGWTKYPDANFWTVYADTQAVASKVKTEELAKLFAAAPDLARVLAKILSTGADDKKFAEICAEAQEILNSIFGRK